MDFEGKYDELRKSILNELGCQNSMSFKPSNTEGISDFVCNKPKLSSEEQCNESNSQQELSLILNRKKHSQYGDEHYWTSFRTGELEPLTVNTAHNSSFFQNNRNCSQSHAEPTNFQPQQVHYTKEFCSTIKDPITVEEYSQWQFMPHRSLSRNDTPLNSGELQNHVSINTLNEKSKESSKIFIQGLSKCDSSLSTSSKDIKSSLNLCNEYPLQSPTKPTSIFIKEHFFPSDHIPIITNTIDSKSRKSLFENNTNTTHLISRTPLMPINYSFLRSPSQLSNHSSNRKNESSKYVHNPSFVDSMIEQCHAKKSEDLICSQSKIDTNKVLTSQNYTDKTFSDSLANRLNSDLKFSKDTTNSNNNTENVINSHNVFKNISSHKLHRDVLNGHKIAEVASNSSKIFKGENVSKLVQNTHRLSKEDLVMSNLKQPKHSLLSMKLIPSKEKMASYKSSMEKFSQVYCADSNKFHISSQELSLDQLKKTSPFSEFTTTDTGQLTHNLKITKSGFFLDLAAPDKKQEVDSNSNKLSYDENSSLEIEMPEVQPVLTVSETLNNKDKVFNGQSLSGQESFQMPTISSQESSLTVIGNDLVQMEEKNPLNLKEYSASLKPKTFEASVTVEISRLKNSKLANKLVVSTDDPNVTQIIDEDTATIIKRIQRSVETRESLYTDQPKSAERVTAPYSPYDTLSTKAVIEETTTLLEKIKSTLSANGKEYKESAFASENPEILVSSKAYFENLSKINAELGGPIKMTGHFETKIKSPHKSAAPVNNEIGLVERDTEERDSQSPDSKDSKLSSLLNSKEHLQIQLKDSLLPEDLKHDSHELINTLSNQNQFIQDMVEFFEEKKNMNEMAVFSNQDLYDENLFLESGNEFSNIAKGDEQFKKVSGRKKHSVMNEPISSSSLALNEIQSNNKIQADFELQDKEFDYKPSIINQFDKNGVYFDSSDPLHKSDKLKQYESQFSALSTKKSGRISRFGFTKSELKAGNMSSPKPIIQESMDVINGQLLTLQTQLHFERPPCTDWQLITSLKSEGPRALYNKDIIKDSHVSETQNLGLKESCMFPSQSESELKLSSTSLSKNINEQKKPDIPSAVKVGEISESEYKKNIAFSKISKISPKLDSPSLNKEAISQEIFPAVSSSSKVVASLSIEKSATLSKSALKVSLELSPKIPVRNQLITVPSAKDSKPSLKLSELSPILSSGPVQHISPDSSLKMFPVPSSKYQEPSLKPLSEHQIISNAKQSAKSNQKKMYVQSPKSSPEPSPKSSPETSPKISPEPSPKSSLEPSPKVSPKPSPKESPESSPKLSPQPSAKLSPQPSPKVSPESSPKQSLLPSPKDSGTSPNSYPEQSPKIDEQKTSSGKFPPEASSRPSVDRINVYDKSLKTSAKHTQTSQTLIALEPLRHPVEIKEASQLEHKSDVIKAFHYTFQEKELIDSKDKKYSTKDLESERSSKSEFRKKQQKINKVLKPIDKFSTSQYSSTNCELHTADHTNLMHFSYDLQSGLSSDPSHYESFFENNLSAGNIKVSKKQEAREIAIEDDGQQRRQRKSKSKDHGPYSEMIKRIDETGPNILSDDEIFHMTKMRETILLNPREEKTSHVYYYHRHDGDINDQRTASSDYEETQRNLEHRPLEDDETYWKHSFLSSKYEDHCSKSLPKENSKVEELKSLMELAHFLSLEHNDKDFQKISIKKIDRKQLKKKSHSKESTSIEPPSPFEELAMGDRITVQRGDFSEVSSTRERSSANQEPPSVPQFSANIHEINYIRSTRSQEQDQPSSSESAPQTTLQAPDVLLKNWSDQCNNKPHDKKMQRKSLPINLKILWDELQEVNRSFEDNRNYLIHLLHTYIRRHTEGSRMRDIEETTNELDEARDFLDELHRQHQLEKKQGLYTMDTIENQTIHGLSTHISRVVSVPETLQFSDISVESIADRIALSSDTFTSDWFSDADQTGLQSCDQSKSRHSVRQQHLLKKKLKKDMQKLKKMEKQLKFHQLKNIDEESRAPNLLSTDEDDDSSSTNICTDERSERLLSSKSINTQTSDLEVKCKKKSSSKKLKQSCMKPEDPLSSYNFQYDTTSDSSCGTNIDSKNCEFSWKDQHSELVIEDSGQRAYTNLKHDESKYLGRDKLQKKSQRHSHQSDESEKFGSQAYIPSSCQYTLQKSQINIKNAKRDDLKVGSKNDAKRSTKKNVAWFCPISQQQSRGVFHNRNRYSPYRKKSSTQHELNSENREYSSERSRKRSSTRTSDHANEGKTEPDMSLQEAFLQCKKKFIEKSRRRLQKLSDASENRQKRKEAKLKKKSPSGSQTNICYKYCPSCGKLRKEVLELASHECYKKKSSQKLRRARRSRS